MGRNTLIGPGVATVDLSILKNISISERLHLQFRAEAFNLFNRPEFGRPSAAVFAGAAATESALVTAGQITSTVGTSRQFQFAIKLIW